MVLDARHPLLLDGGLPRGQGRAERYVRQCRTAPQRQPVTQPCGRDRQISSRHRCRARVGQLSPPGQVELHPGKINQIPGTAFSQYRSRRRVLQYPAQS